ncbi:UNVERIFIED_CONTAM: Protein-tyrosine sulfotransferase [Sesamum latifolium]|uniref:Protein-tyrosine sulfotransferase n=1 Tax=Sesamum latifolium TaxID=2727402 RepID=A0AAW2Y379_9LAMI
MLYVGLTENHRESATMFANIVGAQVITQHTISSSSSGVATNDHSEQSSITNTISDANDQGNSTYHTLEDVSSTGKDEVARDNLTVGKLMEAYESCISSLRNSQSERRVNSLKRISPVNFTKEARRQVPEVVIQEIASLNSLDIELYNYAQHIFTEQQGHMTQPMGYAEKLATTLSLSAYPNFYVLPSWKVLSFCRDPHLLVLSRMFKSVAEEGKQTGVGNFFGAKSNHHMQFGTNTWKQEKELYLTWSRRNILPAGHFIQAKKTCVMSLLLNFVFFWELEKWKLETSAVMGLPLRHLATTSINFNGKPTMEMHIIQ